MHPHARWIARSMARDELNPIDVRELPRLEAICSSRTLEPGTLVLEAGSTVEHVLLLRHGEIELLARSHGGGRTVMAIVRPGGVIADIPLLLGTPMPWDAVASREATVIALDRAGWMQILRTSPGLSMRWMTSIAKRLDADRRRLLWITTKDLLAQVAGTLLEQQEPGPSGLPVVALSHETIAQLLGARRQSVTRVIAELRDRGLVASGYRETVLLDPTGLSAVAEWPAEPAEQSA
jgi:CRP-like cAMP-binding protein